MKNIFLSIGVEYKESEDLSRLRGAIPSALAMAKWAELQGFSSKCVTDEEQPVTVERVRQALEALLGGGGQHRAIVCFAGHGLIRDGAEELWLMNDWRAVVGAINHAQLRERLKGYGIKQVAIVNDACRNLVSDQFRNIVGSPVVRLKSYEHDYVETSVINGTKAGRSSYSTPIDHSDQYCFLTRALYETLTNLNKTWDEKQELSHADLFRILLRKVPEVAREFNVTQLPEPTGIFLDPDTWSNKDKLNSSLKALEPLPAKQQTRTQVTAQSVLQNNKSLLALNSGALELTRGTTNFVDEISSSTVDSIKSKFLNRQNFSSKNISLSGMQAKALYTNSSELLTRNQMGSAATCLIELANSEWCGASIYNYLSTNFIYSNNGIISVSMGDRSSWDDSILMEEIFSALSGYGFSEANETVAEMRQDKHYNPVLGVMAAYTYYRLGAIEDIRRTAYFYGQNQQALPFDIAVLCNIGMSYEKGVFVAHIPDVRERAPMNQTEATRPYTFKATPAISVQVAGRFPWMRQGWGICSENRNEVIRKLSIFEHGLKQSLFTTLDNQTGRDLRDFLQLTKEEYTDE